MDVALCAWLGLVVTYLLTRFAEQRVHRVNYDFLKFAGGEEILAKRMRFFYFISFLPIPLAITEYWGRGSSFVSLEMQAAGITLVGASLALRLWAMRSLGHRWSMRCVFVSGYSRTKTGPYKFLNHPEYLSRLCEGVGLCVFLGSFFAAAAYLLIFLVTVRSVVWWEERQLHALSVDLRESIR